MMYHLRLSQVTRIHQALKDTELEAMTESDFTVVECACRQMAQKATVQKLMATSFVESGVYDRLD